MSAEITLYPDEDTLVDAYVSPDLSHLTLRFDGLVVRLEADQSVLRALTMQIQRVYTAEYIGGEVTANGRNPDALDLALAGIEDHTDRAIRHLEEAIAAARPSPKGEQLRTADEMASGDWVRFPPSQVWRKIESVMPVPYANFGNDRKINFMFGGVMYSETVRPSTLYPYMTDADFGAVCNYKGTTR